VFADGGGAGGGCNDTWLEEEGYTICCAPAPVSLYDGYVDTFT